MTAPPMIDFTTVTREFRSLVDRRRDLQTFLGSGFAAMALVLGNVLEGKLPPGLRGVQEHLFAFYALVLLVLSVILALRMARLHSGMTLNGVLYARLMQAAGRRGDPQRASRINYLGVSFLQFGLMAIIAGFSAAVLLAALGRTIPVAASLGAAVTLAMLAMHLVFHGRAARFALDKIAADPAGPVTPDELEEHVSESLKQANQGMIGEIAFAGLMVFSCFGSMSGLGKIEATSLDLSADFVKNQGPLWFTGLMVFTCLLELVIVLRIRIAIGRFSLQLDPTDQPFRPLRLTDSLLGYLLLAFLFVVTLHILLLQVAPGLMMGVLLTIDAASFALLLITEQAVLVMAGKSVR